MNLVVTYLTGIARETWLILNDSAPWVLFGFSIASLLKAFLPAQLVASQFGGKGLGSIIKAALFGIPLPLCSCGVVPAAISLRRQGASRGATTAFLISTPETGVDSIAISWALLDPLMTVFRPVAALFTAIIAGFIESRTIDNTLALPEEKPRVVGACCPSCAEKAHHEADPEEEEKKSAWVRLKEGFGYSFGELFSDIGRWLLGGILIAGVIAFAVPDDVLSGTVFGRGIIPMLIMLVVGLPLYVCATSSTPIAAALVMKGLSPGAALVFLLSGPASNAGTIMVVAKFLGRKSAFIYVVTIAVVSLIMGGILDYIYFSLGMTLIPAIAISRSPEFGWFNYLCTLVLLLLVGRTFLPVKTRCESHAEHAGHAPETL